MGFIKHNAIVVTGLEGPEIEQAYTLANQVFLNTGHQISSLVRSGTNGFISFFISPDGSKEGWSTSNFGDKARKEFFDGLGCLKGIDAVDVTFGGDSSVAFVERKSPNYQETL